MRSLAALTLVTVASCSSGGAKKSLPFGRIDQAAVSQLRDECTGVIKQTTGADTPFSRFAAEHGIDSPVHLELQCPADANGDSGLVFIDFDEKTGQVIHFSLSIDTRKSQPSHPRVERMLSRYVDPWVNVVTSQQLRDLVKKTTPAHLDGPHWLISGHTLLSPPAFPTDTLQLDIDAS